MRVISSQLRAGVRRKVPPRVRRWVRSRMRRTWPPVGMIRFGMLRRLTPIGRWFGTDRGQPIDRYYIENFLRRHGGADGYALGDIRGHVMEVGDAMYAPRLSAPGQVSKLDVLHVDESNPHATIVGDLTRPETVPSSSFDCIICIQTLLVIYDVRTAVETLHRALRPGGAVLATVPGISQAARPDVDYWGDYWRFTAKSVRRLFEEFFPADCITVEAYGNVLAAISFLHCLAAEDLRRSELDLRDPDYELLIAVRATKPL